MKAHRVYKFKHANGNTATVAIGLLSPYNGAKHKEAAFVLSVFDDDGFMFFRSVYPTYADACGRLAEMGGAWTVIDGPRVEGVEVA